MVYRFIRANCACCNRTDHRGRIGQDCHRIGIHNRLRSCMCDDDGFTGREETALLACLSRHFVVARATRVLLLLLLRAWRNRASRAGAAIGTEPLSRRGGGQRDQ